MAGYNRNERRGILLMSAVILAIVTAMFFVRECRGSGSGSWPAAERIIMSDSLRTAGEDSTENARKKKRKRGKRRSGTRKSRRVSAASDNYKVRDILADTIATSGNID